MFLDLKFHDIPNTVAGACRSAADLGVWMMNVHASGGRRMMEAAAEAIRASGSSAKLIAVTILTSLSQEEIAQEVKFARVWGPSAFDGQSVQEQHILEEGDVVELHR